MNSRLIGILIGTFLFVALILGWRALQTLDTARNTLTPQAGAAPRVDKTVSFGKSRATVIVANPYTAQVFVAEDDVPALARIDANTNQVTAEIPLRGYHTGAAIDVVKNEIYIAQEFSQTVRVINGTTNKIARELPVSGGSPIGELAFDSNTALLYVIQNDLNQIAVLETVRGDLVGTLPLNAHYGDLAINPQTHRLYITSSLEDKVTVVDTTTHAMVATIPIGKNPKYIEVNPATNRIYVSVLNDNVVAVIDGITNEVLTKIPTDTPLALAVNPLLNRVYVGNFNSKALTVIDGETNRVRALLPLEATPTLLAVLPALNRIYISSDEAHGVFVIHDAVEKSHTELSLTSDETVRGLRLIDNAAPLNWHQPDFDDRSWSNAVRANCLGFDLLPPYPNSKWIWLPGCSQYKESILLRKTFDLPSDNIQGVLRVRANEASEVHLNGQELGATRLWATEFWFDLTPYLRQGKNVLAVRANHINDGGYGAVLFQGTLSATNGR
jgi:YVTN family beta-propeller protein